MKMAATNQSAFRNRQLARIHIAKKQLGLSDDVYRGILLQVGGVNSSGDLDEAGRARVLDHFRHLGFEYDGGKGKSRGKAFPSYPGRPTNMDDEDRGKMLRKIEALLTIGRKPWAYADGVAKRVCKVHKVQWLRAGDLYKVVRVLASNAKRYGWGEERTKAKANC
jgi:phage gp16-like protein